MKRKKLLKLAHTFSRSYAVTDGRKFRLKAIDPGDTGDLKSQDKPRVQEVLATGLEAMAELQDILYAQAKWGVLLIFQAMDAAGKDSAIKHVMSGVNPQGCKVVSFKSPSTEELDHDYLWRCQKQLPRRGEIGIFNRSYYEEVLVVRVHRQLLANEKIPEQLIAKDIWSQRYKEIVAFERYLTHNGFIIRKFFLHVSRKEQKKRFLERLENPDKYWKFSASDIQERALWKDYMRAYEEMIQATATGDAPWYVVPADHKWFTRVVVAAAIVDALVSRNPCYPKLSTEKLKQLAAVRRKLLAER